MPVKFQKDKKFFRLVSDTFFSIDACPSLQFENLRCLRDPMAAAYHEVYALRQNVGGVCMFVRE